MVCIFDLDGTLIDTLDSLLLSVNLTLDELKLSNITREQCRDFVGNGARFLIKKSISSVFPACDDDLVNHGLEIYSRIFREYCMYKVDPYYGIREVLESLKKQGLRLAVLSNKPDERTVEIVENLFGTDFFEYVQGQKEGVPRKPDPKSVDYVRSKLSVDREDCIYIGDSEVDMETGIHAGVTTIGVSWGFRDRYILEESGVEIIVDSPEKLLEQINILIKN